MHGRKTKKPAVAEDFSTVNVNLLRSHNQKEPAALYGNKQREMLKYTVETGASKPGVSLR